MATCQRCGATVTLTYRGFGKFRKFRSLCGPCVRAIDPHPEVWWQGWQVTQVWEPN
jgi:hypothetical protein